MSIILCIYIHIARLVPSTYRRSFSTFEGQPFQLVCNSVVCACVCVCPCVWHPLGIGVNKVVSCPQGYAAFGDCSSEALAEQLFGASQDAFIVKNPDTPVLVGPFGFTINQYLVSR